MPAHRKRHGALQQLALDAVVLIGLLSLPELCSVAGSMGAMFCTGVDAVSGLPGVWRGKLDAGGVSGV